MLLYQPSFHFYTLPFSSFLTYTLYPMSFLITLISSFPLLSYSIHQLTLSSSHFHSHLISSHHTSHHHSHCLLSSYSSIHFNHIPCLLSSSHLHHAHHLAYSSIIHPTSSSFHPPSIPSFSHFSFFHSSILPWCSSRFPQNSFSPISFTIPFYSLFHPPFLFYSSTHSLLFSFSLSSHFITSHFTSSFSLSPLLSYSSIHSNHIPCLLSSFHLHHPHHLAYSSIIHPTSSSYHLPSIPSFSHFSLFHSSISPWCSSRFPQNSFSPISFSILSSSLFHPPFLPISLPSPSSPHIFAFHCHSHL